MEEVRRSDGTVMKCYRKISVCCKAATCELGIMCQVGEKIEAECKVCEGQGKCHLAFKEDALACEKIQAVLSDKNVEKYLLEKRLQFECEFCAKRCPSIYSCDHRYQADKCKPLFDFLKEKGFIKEQIKEQQVEIKEEKEKEEKVVQFPVDMDEMQRNILISLLNARKECTDQNLLTAHGCVAIIDALFYLVKERPIIPAYCVGVDMGDPKGDSTGGLDK